MRDPDIYGSYEQIILAHNTRDITGLAYSQQPIAKTFADPLMGDAAKAKLHYDRRKPVGV